MGAVVFSCISLKQWTLTMRSGFGGVWMAAPLLLALQSEWRLKVRPCTCCRWPKGTTRQHLFCPTPWLYNCSGSYMSQVYKLRILSLRRHGHFPINVKRSPRRPLTRFPVVAPSLLLCCRWIRIKSTDTCCLLHWKIMEQCHMSPPASSDATVDGFIQ